MVWFEFSNNPFVSVAPDFRALIIGEGISAAYPA